MDNRFPSLFTSESIFLNNLYGHYFFHSIYDFVLIFPILVILIFFSLILKINFSRFVILLFHLFSFVFFLGFLVDINTYPDMAFFYESIFEVRNGMIDCIGKGSENISQGQKTICFVSFLPFFNFSLASFGLFNLLFFYLLYFYLYKNNIFTKYSEIIYLFLPSIFLYSSLPLKEFIIFLSSIILILEVLIFRRIILIIFFAYLLYLLKIQNLFILVASFVFIYLIKLIYNKQYLYFVFNCIFFGICYFLLTELLPTKNYNFYSLSSASVAKRSLGIENNIQYTSYDTISIFLIWELFLGLFKYFIYPSIFHIQGINIKIYFVIENLFFTFTVIYLMIKSFFNYNFKHLYIDFSLILFASLYGYVNYNYFNMHRYAFSITLVYIIIKFFLINNNNEQKT